jgi:hypothetical protein
MDEMIKSKWHVEELRKLHKEAVAHTAEVYMNKVIIKAITEVPLDTGRLANTGRVERVKVTTNHVNIKASFGGAEGLMGGSMYANRIMEPIAQIIQKNETPGGKYMKMKQEWIGISTTKNTLGRVTYAIKWHENSTNFQNGRKFHYLIDPFTLIFNTGKELLLNEFCNSIGMRFMLG